MTEVHVHFYLENYVHYFLEGGSPRDFLPSKPEYTLPGFLVAHLEIVGS